MERLLNVAVPLTAATVAVPPSVPLPGFVPMATVTEAVLVVRLPSESCICTVTAGAIVAPPLALVGCCNKTSLLAAPAVMLNALLVVVGLGRPLSVAVRVYPVPARLIERLLKVATPLTAFTVADPLSVPLLGFVPIAMVTESVLLATTVPLESSMETFTPVPESI